MDEVFAGMWMDQELWYTQYRRQSPSLGRWTSPDPLAGDITNPQSLNRYAYVMNNPTTLIDPSGLGSQDACAMYFHLPPNQEHCPFNRVGALGCTIDGINGDCGLARSLIASGAGVGCRDPNCNGLRVQQGPGGTTQITRTVRVWLPGSSVSVSDSASGSKSTTSTSGSWVNIQVSQSVPDTRGSLPPAATAIFSQVARNTGVMTTGKFWMQVTAVSAMPGVVAHIALGGTSVTALYETAQVLAGTHPEVLFTIYDVANVLSPGPSIPETALGWFVGLDERSQH